MFNAQGPLTRVESLILNLYGDRAVVMHRAEKWTAIEFPLTVPR